MNTPDVTPPLTSKEALTMLTATTVLTKHPDGDKVNSVRFDSKDDKSPLQSVYIRRLFPAINVATKVEITIKVIA